MKGERQVILAQPFGGLGDNLSYSTLPELYKKSGTEKFYISSDNKYRNDEIYDLVWKSNPYVDGIIDKEHTVGWIPDRIPLKTTEGNNLISCWEESHGFDVIVPLKRPNIYYSCDQVDTADKMTIIDLGCTSGINMYNDVSRLVDYIADNYDDVYMLRSTKHGDKINNSVGANLKCTYLEYNNIFQYCDLVRSCKKFVCLFSGSSVIAAAVRDSDTDCLYTPIDVHRISLTCGYYYNNITYKNIYDDKDENKLIR